MPQLAEIPQPVRARIEQIGAADLVIALFAPGAQSEFESVVASIRESLAGLYQRVRIAIVYGGNHAAPEPMPEAEAPEKDQPVRLLEYPSLEIETGSDPAHSIADAYRSVFAIGSNLGARAMAVIVSDLESVTPQWIYRMVQPLLDLDFDLVTPCYSHGRLEGLLNSGIVAPLTRALYGRRIQHPLGPDFGFSGRLASRLLANAAASRPPARSVASIAVDAICEGFEVCQAGVGIRHYPHVDWTNQSQVLVQILGPLFDEIGRHASQWQKIRGSEDVPLFGEEPRLIDVPSSGARDGAGAMDIRWMIESYQLGCRNLGEIWGAVLPPSILLDLAKLARMGPDQFRMPDRLWARVLYDFALGYRLRIMNPDHLLRAITPVYLGWAASYALELSEADEAAMAQRTEQLALAFEAAKPYAVSRWRWPDRFNP
ncbi:MAG: hypothetical protein ACRD30_06580 [Bryobacteraceae bacterium]